MLFPSKYHKVKISGNIFEPSNSIYQEHSDYDKI